MNQTWFTKQINTIISKQAKDCKIERLRQSACMSTSAQQSTLPITHGPKVN